MQFAHAARALLQQRVDGGGRQRVPTGGETGGALLNNVIVQTAAQPAVAGKRPDEAALTIQRIDLALPHLQGEGAGIERNGKRLAAGKGKLETHPAAPSSSSRSRRMTSTGCRA